MKKKIIFISILLFVCKTFSQTKTIHVFVALCDNQFQGIVPVPKKLGNGKDPKNNLYWGAAYGVASFFKNKTKDWKIVSKIKSEKPYILDRILFKHKTKDVYMLADAYDGEKIKTCTEDFLKASNQQNREIVTISNKSLSFGGASNLQAYIGHNGLMDFKVTVHNKKTLQPKNDAIVLACFSKNYFSDKLKEANATPILLTTNLMAPEAYTLEAAIDQWLIKRTPQAIRNRAAKAYHKYQKCGLKGAQRLFSSDF